MKSNVSASWATRCSSTRRLSAASRSSPSNVTCSNLIKCFSRAMEEYSASSIMASQSAAASSGSSEFLLRSTSSWARHVGPEEDFSKRLRSEFKHSKATWAVIFLLCFLVAILLSCSSIFSRDSSLSYLTRSRSLSRVRFFSSSSRFSSSPFSSIFLRRDPSIILTSSSELVAFLFIEFGPAFGAFKTSSGFNESFVTDVDPIGCSGLAGLKDPESPSTISLLNKVENLRSLLDKVSSIGGSRLGGFSSTPRSWKMGDEVILGDLRDETILDRFELILRGSSSEITLDSDKFVS
mmetsp:Transcript_6454/g.12920  ORF Transcript_6454/g.12920 Transcript_6454/m.12920 type:complete len:294 (+) Transcript_6454:1420-2301(+)